MSADLLDTHRWLHDKMKLQRDQTCCGLRYIFVGHILKNINDDNKDVVQKYSASSSRVMKVFRNNWFFEKEAMLLLSSNKA